MKPHYNVLIITPGGTMTASYVRSLLKTTHALDMEGLTWNFLNASGSLVAMVREEAVAGYGVNDANMKEVSSGLFTYDKMIWIDSDIEWEPTDFFRLYMSDKDIISGCYLMDDRHIPIYNQPRGGMMPEKMLLEKNKPFEVAGCGFGFLCVKYGVFEKMPRPWFGPESVPDGKGNDVFYLVGEDLSWCTKAIKSGFKIWVDPMVRVIHQKTYKLYWMDQIQKFKGINE